MARPHSTRYTVAALLLLGISVVILVSLGQWQLRRADERRAILAAIEAGRKQAPLPLSAATPAHEMAPWRVAEASGQWLPQFSVLLDNRNLDGKPGYWLATPLLLDGGSRQALLVLRGWIPRVMQGQPEVPATPPGEQAARRAVRARAAPVRAVVAGRRCEVRPAGGAAGAGRRRAAGAEPGAGRLRAGHRAQAAAHGAEPVRRRPPRRRAGARLAAAFGGFQKNTFYAVQWFSFALFAAIAWLVVMAGALKRMRQRQREQAGPGAEPPRGHGKPAATTS